MTVAPQVFFSFDLPFSGAFFTLDDPVKGVLDNATYTLSGDIPQDVTSYVRSVAITRGRQSEFDEFQAGVATLKLNNHDRTFDPAYTSSPFFGNITRGKQVRILSATGVPLFAGIVDDWDFDYDTSGESVATVKCVDGLSTLVGINFDEWTATGSQLTGARVTAVLDRPEVAWPASRDIGTGIATLTNDTIAEGTNVLTYLQTLGRAELGRIFDSRVGLLTFRDRHYVPLHLSGAVEFGGSGHPINQVARREGKDTVRNHVKVTLTTGATETAIDESSTALQGTATLFLDGIPLATSDAAFELAEFIVNAYATPATRFASFTVPMPRLSATDQDAINGLDIGDPVAVAFTPNGLGDPVEQTCVVEGFQDDFVPKDHRRTVYVSRADQTSLFILDDATYGALDGPGLLAF